MSRILHDAFDSIKTGIGNLLQKNQLISGIGYKGSKDVRFKLKDYISIRDTGLSFFRDLLRYTKDYISLSELIQEKCTIIRVVNDTISLEDTLLNNGTKITVTISDRLSIIDNL